MFGVEVPLTLISNVPMPWLMKWSNSKTILLILSIQLYLLTIWYSKSEGFALIQNDRGSTGKKVILKILLVEDLSPQHYEHVQLTIQEIIYVMGQ